MSRCTSPHRERFGTSVYTKVNTKSSLLDVPRIWRFLLPFDHRTSQPEAMKKKSVLISALNLVGYDATQPRALKSKSVLLSAPEPVRHTGNVARRTAQPRAVKKKSVLLSALNDVGCDATQPRAFKKKCVLLSAPEPVGHTGNVARRN